MHHIYPPNESAELTKVSAVGLFGMLAGLKLADINLIVAIMVGLTTFTYMVMKTVFLWKDRREHRRRRRAEYLD